MAVASAIFGGESFFYGLASSSQSWEELRDIKGKLDLLSQHLDSIGDDLKSLQTGGKWLEGAKLYQIHIQHLIGSFKHLTNNLDLQEDKSLGMSDLANEWAQVVLNLQNYGSDGIGQVSPSSGHPELGRHTAIRIWLCCHFVGHVWSSTCRHWCCLGHCSGRPHPHPDSEPFRDPGPPPPT